MTAESPTHLAVRSLSFQINIIAAMSAAATGAVDGILNHRKGVVILRREIIMGTLLVAGLVSAAGARSWKINGELSHVKASGNTESETLSGKSRYTKDWTQAGLELEGGGLGSSSDGETMAEQYFASEKVSWKWSERNFVFERFRWDKDRFAGIDHRYDSSIGVGREIVQTVRQTLSAEVGGGYIKEDRLGSPNEDFASGRAAFRYSLKLSPTSDVFQMAEYISNLEDGDDYRVNTETGLVASINTFLSLKTAYQWKRVNKPPDGFEKDDTLISTALIVNY